MTSSGPGWINSHDHLELNLFPVLGEPPYDDHVQWARDIHRRHGPLIARIQAVPVPLRARWGALKNLLNGVTTVVQHGDRVDLGPIPLQQLNPRTIHSTRFDRWWRLRLLRPRDPRPVVMHLAEGRDAFARSELATVLRANRLRRPLVAVHGMGLRLDQAPAFAALIWCPGSNRTLYDHVDDVAPLASATTLLLGTDATLTGSWRLCDHLDEARRSGTLSDTDLLALLSSPARAFWDLPAPEAEVRWRVADPLSARPEDLVSLVIDGSPVIVDPEAESLLPRGHRHLRCRVGTSFKLLAPPLAEVVRAVAALDLPVDRFADRA